jgi:hypothetical protein
MPMRATRPLFRQFGRAPGLGRLDFRAPEERFATDQQIARRYQEPVRAPALEKAIASFMDSWRAGDEAGATLAANEIKSHTSAYFQQQGVPTVAHPVLPSQFVREVVDAVETLPSSERESRVRGVADRFGPDLRFTVARELAPALTAAMTSRVALDTYDGGSLARFAEGGDALALGADRGRDPRDSTDNLRLCDANRAEWEAAVEEFGAIAKKIPKLEGELADRRVRLNYNLAQQRDLRRRLESLTSMDPMISGLVIGSGIAAGREAEIRKVKARIDWLQTQINSDAQRISELLTELHDLREAKRAVARRKAFIKRGHAGCKGTLVDPYEYLT